MYRATKDSMLPTTITGSPLGLPPAPCLAAEERHSPVVPAK
jgi:hypothetical protein